MFSLDLIVVLVVLVFFYLRYHAPLIITFKRVHSSAVQLETAYHKAACYDIFGVEDIVIPPNQWREIPTGVIVAPWPHIYIPLINISLTPLGNVACKIHTRSGLAIKRGQRAHLGIIDNDYRGVLSVLMFNHNSFPVRYRPGDKIAQLEFYRVPKVYLWERDKLSKTMRGERGFGSSGK